MFLKFVSFCIALSFLGVRSQRIWGSSSDAYNAGFSNSLNSANKNQFNTVSNNGNSWESDFSSFGGNPMGTSFGNSVKTSGLNSNKPGKASSDWQSDFNKRPNEKKLSSFTNLASSSNWNSNSNNFSPSEKKDNNLPFSSWEFNSNKPFPGKGGSQNSKPGNRESNTSKQNKANEKLPEFDYEDNSLFSLGSSNKKKKLEPTSNSFDDSGNWRPTSQQQSNKNSENSKSDLKKNKKPQKTSESNTWGSNNGAQPGWEVALDSFSTQSETKSPASDTSILDELDKNDWYFGKESNYPKPPFRSTLNIDVSELWNFDKNKKSTQNNRGGGSGSGIGGSIGNYNKQNYNSRRNRQIERFGKAVNDIQCKCVNVNLCEEKDMIISQADVKFDSRPLEEFRCKRLTEVCCTNPKLTMSFRANFNEEKERLRCGQRRPGENLFEDFGRNIAKPSEFPWSLKLENAEINCSATLIHNKLALTAAHCVTGKNPEDLTLKAGIWNADNEPPQSREISDIILHPDYNSRNPRNDIALLVSKEAFELTDNVNIVCLPVTNDKWDSSQCVVTGWKPQQIRDQYLEVLEKSTVNFLPQAECQNILLVTDLWRNYILHDSFVCGLDKSESGSCTGDEGGFLVCPSKKQPDTYLQIGIVSKGMNCDNFGRPGIFTNVLKFLDWINKNYFDLGLFHDIDIRILQ